MKRLFLEDRIVLLFIIVNTVVMFLSGFWKDVTLFEYADAFFTLFFLIEAIVKIHTYGTRGYFIDGWNRFDFILVIMALPSLVLLGMGISGVTSAILSLRTIRIFKTFRLLRFIPNIQQLLVGVKLAMQASGLVCFAFFIFIVIFAILTSSLFGSYAPEFFGNPGISMYSIFRLFTIEGWYEMPDAIAASAGDVVGILARIYFVFLLFSGGIIGMSLINSLFVDAMASDNNNEVLEKLKQIEDKLDYLQNK